LPEENQKARSSERAFCFSEHERLLVKLNGENLAVDGFIGGFGVLD
jgi:hypothetical protein